MGDARPRSVKIDALGRLYCLEKTVAEREISEEAEYDRRNGDAEVDQHRHGRIAGELDRIDSARRRRGFDLEDVPSQRLDIRPASAVDIDAYRGRIKISAAAAAPK